MDRPANKLLFVGLGNPGLKYAKTRHNIGFRVLDTLAKKRGVSFKVSPKFSAEVAKEQTDDFSLFLIKPETFMNLSGSSVKRFMDYYQLEPRQLIVVVDDIALPFGKLRLRMQGSSGGHNGLKSIEACLGTQNYPRLRVGISHDALGATNERDLADYVLAPFSKEEEGRLVAVLDQTAVFLERLLKEDLEKVMKEINKNSPKETEENKDESEKSEII